MFQIYELTKFNSLHYLVVIDHSRLLLKRIGSILHRAYPSQHFFESFFIFFDFFLPYLRPSELHTPGRFYLYLCDFVNFDSFWIYINFLRYFYIIILFKYCIIF